MLQGASNNLGWIQNTCFNQVFPFQCGCVETNVIFFSQSFLNDDTSFQACIACDSSQRLFQSTKHDLCSGGFIAFQFQAFDGFSASQQSHSTAHNDSLVYSGSGCRKCILYASFSLFHFCFCSGTYIDHSNSTGQSSQSFLKLFAIVVGRSIFNLLFKLTNSSLKLFGLSSAFNNGGIFFIHAYLVRFAQVADVGIFQLHSQVF